MSDLIELEDEDQLPVVPPGTHRPPFLFARRHGVLVTGESGGKVQVLHRPGVDPMALVELVDL